MTIRTASFDISSIPDESKTFENGITRAQVIHLWTGEEPFIAYHYMVVDGPLEACEHVTSLRDLMNGYIDPMVVGRNVGPFYTSLAGFVIRIPGETYRYLRPHIEAQIERGIVFHTPRGRPRIGSLNAVDWSGVDWSRRNIEISREKNVRPQTVAAARKRHAPKTVRKHVKKEEE